jgi:signal transduction histidine kinase
VPSDQQEVLGALRGEPHITAAAVFDSQGRLFADYFQSELTPRPRWIPEREGFDFAEGYLVIKKPIVHNGVMLGTIALKSDLDEMYERFRLYAVIVTMVLIGSFLLAFILSRILRHAITDPVLELAQTARRVSDQKTYDVRARKFGNDELGLLADSFNNMLQQIKKAEEEIRLLNSELEQRVQHRTAELAASNKEMEAFIYSVSHDLRAPLRHIAAFGEILEEDYGHEFSPETKDYLNRMIAGARNMSQLVDDLLYLARIGRTELKRQATNLDTVVDEVLEDIKPEIANRNIEWRIQHLPVVECDRGLIKQVFANLIANAVKYTRRCEHAVIEIGPLKSVRVDDQDAICIRDNGVGFDMKFADKLFGVFQRLHRAEDFEGTGVGLATVERIVRRHGGHVWAEGEPHRGAAFYFTLGK